METAADAAAERCDSPVEPDSPLCLSMLRAACRSVAADVTSPRLADVTAAATCDVITSGPRRGRLLAEPAVDADAFFEYDLEGAAAAGGESGGEAGGGGGPDTGCALTSPTDGSRGCSTPSPPTDSAPAGAANGRHPVAAGSGCNGDSGHQSGDHARAQPATSPGAACPGGLPARHLYENPLSTERPPSPVPAEEAAEAPAASWRVSVPVPVPVPTGGRSRAVVTRHPQQSPSEKVDAWLLACNGQTADADAADDAAHGAAAATDCAVGESDKAEDEDDATAEAEYGTAEADDCQTDEALTDADELDICGLLTRGCQLLELERPPDGGEPRPDSLLLPAESPPDEPPASTSPASTPDDDAADAGGTGSESAASSEFLAAERLKRSSSLKSSKTPPLTPGRKKFVRFADSLGLDLQQVRMFRDEVPTVPAAAFAGLDELQLCGSPESPSFLMSFSAAPPPRRQLLGGGRQLVPLFLQPTSGLGFEERLRRDKVCLVSVTCHEDDWSVRGVVRVLNMDYCKSVCVRYTLDEWRTWSDAPATYVAGSCDGFADRFQFALFCGQLRPGQRLHFAVAFRCQGREFWDNSQGANYTVLCALAGDGCDDEWSGGRF